MGGGSTIEDRPRKKSSKRGFAEDFSAEGRKSYSKSPSFTKGMKKGKIEGAQAQTSPNNPQKPQKKRNSIKNAVFAEDDSDFGEKSGVKEKKIEKNEDFDEVEKSIAEIVVEESESMYSSHIGGGPKSAEKSLDAPTQQQITSLSEVYNYKFPLRKKESLNMAYPPSILDSEENILEERSGNSEPGGQMKGERRKSGEKEAV